MRLPDLFTCPGRVNCLGGLLVPGLSNTFDPLGRGGFVMSILKPVTAVDPMVWQCRAARSLVEILDRALRREMPRVYWSLSVTGSLVGRCIAADMEARRAAFIAWVDFLGIADWRAWDGDGVTHMHGTTSDAFHGAAGPRSCRVVITADLYTDEPGGVGA